MNKVNYITVSGFKSNNPTVDVSRFDDTTISGLISRASARVDGYLGYSLLTEHITGELQELIVSNTGDIIVYPYKRPVLTVNAAKVIQGATSYDLSITGNYDISEADDRMVKITAPVGNVSAGSLRGLGYYIELDYNAGYEYADIPDWAKEATELYVKGMLSGPSIAGAKRISQGSLSIDYSDVSSGATLGAETLLRPHRRVS